MFSRRTWIIIVVGSAFTLVITIPLYNVWNFIPSENMRDLWVGLGWTVLFLGLAVLVALVAYWSEHNKKFR
jgi:hypothetical protein